MGHGDHSGDVGRWAGLWTIAIPAAHYTASRAIQSLQSASVGGPKLCRARCSNCRVLVDDERWNLVKDDGHEFEDSF